MGLLGKLFGRSGYEEENVYGTLRQRLLQVRPADLGLAISSDPIFGVVMETGIDRDVATFACLADGTVSLYLSTGGGVIGGGQHETVRSAAAELLRITNEYAAAYIAACAPGVRAKLPRNGEVHFYLLTHSGAYNAACDERALEEEEDPFANLFANCHVVMAEVREIESGAH